jgi:hypothetical protein
MIHCAFVCSLSRIVSPELCLDWLSAFVSFLAKNEKELVRPIALPEEIIIGSLFGLGYTIDCPSATELCLFRV